MLNPKHLGVGLWPLNASWGFWEFLGLGLVQHRPAYHLAPSQPQGLSLLSKGAGATGIWDNLV